MITTPPASPLQSRHLSLESEPYLAPEDFPQVASESGSAPGDGWASGSSMEGEYQVPRNAKKRSGLVTRDPSTKEHFNEDEYVEMINGQPLTDDEKAAETSVKTSKKESIKRCANTLKRIPQNVAGKIRLFQDRQKSDKREKPNEENVHEKPQYDVPKGILK